MTRPLRVAIFGESYLPYLSGVTVATEALARGLGAAGHEVLLLVPRPAGGAAPGTAGALGPEPRYAWLPSYQGPRPAPADYRMPWPRWSAAARLAVGFRPDIVHAQSPFVSGIMARAVARRAGAPLVFTHHTRFGDYRHYLGPLAAPGGWLVDRYLRRFWAGCAAIVAPGGRLATEIAAHFDRRRGTVVRAIPTGIELGALRALPAADPRGMVGWASDATVVVSVGRLAREKSVEEVVDAFALAADEDASLRLLMVGGGPMEAALRLRAQEPALRGRVHLAGRLPRADALALASGSDLFALASRTETQGLVVAEALGLGLPVIAVDGPGVEDAVRPGIDGRLIRSEPAEGRVPGLAGAMVELAGNPVLRARLAAAAVDGAHRFDAAARMAEVERLYRELIDTRH